MFGSPPLTLQQQFIRHELWDTVKIQWEENQWREFSPDIESVGILILNFSASQTVGNNFAV